ncbi:helix-turn-helix domain-containing protein [Caulobacter sp. S45]|jgi:transcriptional regulator with XRE-family HTH domain|uniref:helix-turn-helix domain-containing protein n=1 Tax=Caulobacter sp. S45 TaxID=1641861 RepID=UPI00131C7E3F|nr:helix-turn-helix transcriptional regulator [Caulobacter sp. S45]
MKLSGHFGQGPDPIDVEVGLTIRELRRARGLSQAALGEKLQVTFQQIQKYERGTNRISASMLVKAAEAMDVHAADLLPKSDTPRLPEKARFLTTLRGASELLDAYAAIKSPAHRKAVLKLTQSLATANTTETGA